MFPSSASVDARYVNAFAVFRSQLELISTDPRVYQFLSTDVQLAVFHSTFSILLVFVRHPLFLCYTTRCRPQISCSTGITIFPAGEYIHNHDQHATTQRRSLLSPTGILSFNPALIFTWELVLIMPILYCPYIFPWRALLLYVSKSLDAAFPASHAFSRSTNTIM